MKVEEACLGRDVRRLWTLRKTYRGFGDVEGTLLPTSFFESVPDFLTLLSWDHPDTFGAWSHRRRETILLHRSSARV